MKSSVPEKKELDLEKDMALSPEDLAAMKVPLKHDDRDLNHYLDFLEQIGAFESRKVKTFFYDEEFRL